MTKSEELQYCNSCDRFLRRNPTRESRTYWLNLYENRKVSYLFSTRDIADDAANPNRIACVKIVVDFEHGEGL